MQAVHFLLFLKPIADQQRGDGKSSLFEEDGQH